MKIHIVKQGDTLFELSKKYNVPLQAIIDANPQLSDPNKLNIGDKIKIPTAPVPVPGGDNVLYKHVVKKGDTLYKLAKAWGVPLQALIDANPQLSDPNVLNIGDIINIPKVTTSPAPKPTPLPATPVTPPSHGTKKDTSPKHPDMLPPKAEEVKPKPVQPITPPPAPQIIQQIQIIEENTYTKVEKSNCEPQHHEKKEDCGCKEKEHADSNLFHQYQTPVQKVSSYYDLPPITPYSVDETPQGNYPGLSNIPTYPVQTQPNFSTHTNYQTNYDPQEAQWGMAPAQHSGEISSPAEAWGGAYECPPAQYPHPSHSHPHPTHPNHCHPYTYIMPVHPCVFTPAGFNEPGAAVTPWGAINREQGQEQFQDQLKNQDIIENTEEKKEVKISSAKDSRVSNKRKTASGTNRSKKSSKTSSKSTARQNPWTI